MGTAIVTDHHLRDGVTGRPPRGSWVYHLLRPVMITVFTLLLSMLILPFANGSTPGMPGDILSYNSSTRSWAVDTSLSRIDIIAATYSQDAAKHPMSEMMVGVPRGNALLDSGAGVSVLKDAANFPNLQVVDVKRVRIANGDSLSLLQGGTALLPVIQHDGVSVLPVPGAYLCKEFPTSLISECSIKSAHGTVIHKSWKNDDSLTTTDSQGNTTSTIPIHTVNRTSWLECAVPSSPLAQAAFAKHAPLTCNVSPVFDHDAIPTPSSEHDLLNPWSPSQTATDLSPQELRRNQQHRKLGTTRRPLPAGLPQTSRKCTLAQLHQRNHFGDKNNRQLAGNSTGLQVTTKSRSLCEDCATCKARRHTVTARSNNPRPDAPSELISLDHCGPIKTTGIGGYKYILRARCVATNFVCSLPARTCTAAETIALTETIKQRYIQHGHRIGTFITDGHLCFASTNGSSPDSSSA